MDNSAKQQSPKVIDLDKILAEGGQYTPAWEGLFTPVAVVAIKAAAEKVECSPEEYIQIATLRQLDADKG
ncbi:hypothetical protein EJC49_14865 [Aquibium carbonis]|uniref:Uncharacterized protein n=1 Tax=Aquibium carbonis TaxID=2495581 RepID=A0A3R9Y713_9HYPH|nr:hypothetical protein [Aquibium carbonis]RST85583.1 hypothetical protein EJC49_14865 [Aquibium carbonis]